MTCDVNLFAESGHVDAGKSTMMGRLMYDLGQMEEKKDAHWCFTPAEARGGLVQVGMAPTRGEKPINAGRCHTASGKVRPSAPANSACVRLRSD